MVKSPRLLLIGASLLLLAGIRGTHAAEIKIVSPNDYEHREGEGAVGEDCCTPFRGQQVFPAEDFAALGNKPHWLVDLTFRPDESVTSPRTVYAPDIEYRLTTTQVANLSSNFAVNLGTDYRHFYRGPETLVAHVDGSGPGPRAFYDVDYPGFTPYLYDPSQGNLLLDFIGWQGYSPSPRGDVVPGMLTVLGASSPLFTSGDRGGAFVRQFTFIPALETATWNVDAGGNWSLPANWASSVPNITGARAVLGSVITAPRTVTVDTPITVGRLDFDNANAYTIDGPQVLTLDAMSGDAQINVASGTHSISAPVGLVDNATISVMSAASRLALTGELNSIGQNVTKAGLGTLTLNNIRAAGLSVNGGTVAIAPSGTNAGTSNVGALTIAGATDAWTAKLDLNNNDAVVRSTAATKSADVARLYNQLEQGYADGNWTGQGITSSAAATNANLDTGLALVDNAVIGFIDFSGQTVNADSILLKYTYYGDIDLNGRVDGDDLTTFALNFGRTTGATQVDGDIDFNGRVDGEDLTMFANNFGKGIGSPLAAGAVAAVPEPSTIVLGIVAAFAAVIVTLRRRYKCICTDNSG